MTSPRRGPLALRLAAVAAILAACAGLAVPARAASPVSALPLAAPLAAHEAALEAAALEAAAPAVSLAPLASPRLLPAAPTPNPTPTVSGLPAKPGVTFTLRPASAKDVDARANWTYRNVKPGQVWIDHLAVQNYSYQAATFSVYSVDAYNGTAGDFQLLRREDKQRGVGTWIELGTHTVTVPPRQAVLMPFRFRVPRRVQPGDHAGGIIATFRTSRMDAKGNSIAVESRIGSRMYVRIAGKLHPRITIERTSAAWLASGFPRGSARVTWTVHNTGNVRLEGTQSVRVRGLIGKGVYAKDVPELPELLPGGSATFSTRVDHLWPMIFQNATVVLDPRSVVGNVDPALEQARVRVRFLSSIWLWILLVVLLAGGLWWWLARRRRRRGPKLVADPWGPVPTEPERVIVLPDGRTPFAVVPAAATGPTGRRRARTTAWAGAFLVAVTSAVLPFGPGTAAAHAAGDELTFLPAKGADITPMFAVTSGPCPQAAVGVIGRMFGPGLPADGAIVIANTQAGVRTDTGFGMPLQDSLQGLALAMNVTFRGRYQIVLSCIDELGMRTYAQFKGALTFPGPHTFVGKAPARPPAFGVPVGYMTDTFPELRQQATPSPLPSGSAPAASPGASSSAKPQAVAPGKQGAKSPAPGQQAGQALDATPSSGEPDGGSSLPIVLVALALLAAAGGAWAWGRRPVPAMAPVQWVDDDAPKPAKDGEQVDA